MEHPEKPQSPEDPPAWFVILLLVLIAAGVLVLVSWAALKILG